MHPLCLRQQVGGGMSMRSWVLRPSVHNYEKKIKTDALVNVSDTSLTPFQEHILYYIILYNIVYCDNCFGLELVLKAPPLFAPAGGRLDEKQRGNVYLNKLLFK